jgi:hypothetical protein
MTVTVSIVGVILFWFLSIVRIIRHLKRDGKDFAGYSSLSEKQIRSISGNIGLSKYWEE